MIRFATLCDIPNCLKRSEEYTTWPTCIDCERDFCPAHGIITIEADLNQPEKGFCYDCQVLLVANTLVEKEFNDRSREN